MLPISDVDYVKLMLLPHGGWPMAAGPVSRLGSIEPGDKNRAAALTTPIAPSTRPQRSWKPDPKASTYFNQLRTVNCSNWHYWQF